MSKTFSSIFVWKRSKSAVKKRSTLTWTSRRKTRRKLERYDHFTRRMSSSTDCPNPLLLKYTDWSL